MPTKHINKKSVYKGIRFPHELIAKIDRAVEEEKNNTPSISFSSWVMNACQKELDRKKRKQPK
ncbi:MULTISPECIES: YlcI/YnfO family protein [unclassified Gilliamella]|uniref:YlcI/YnfO family protein n=1 Tax=unclassified Gilliamella TaxID=2685620 RepID=UPI00157FF0C7|nr:YlcI/YnfO family protein [Gilliamella sp. ESL0250]NUF50325.1 hypothetical protein [Gilliamella sp. ESL0250]